MDLAAQRTEARLRHDIDEKGAGAVILGGEAVAGDVDGLDLCLWRQRRTLEALYADDRWPARHVRQLLAQHRWIVRERVDLLSGERRPKRRRLIDGRLLPIPRDGHRVGNPLQRQRHRVAVVAGADADVRVDLHLEAGKLRLDRVAAQRQRLEQRHALIGRRHRRGACRLGCLVCPEDGDGRARQHAAGLIDDRDLQPAAARLRKDHARARQHDDGYGERFRGSHLHGC